MAFSELRTVLYLVTTTSGALEAFEKMLPFFKKHNSHLVELFVIDPLVIIDISRFSGKSRAQIEIEHEENGWRYLYEIEETTKDAGLYVEVSLQIGNPLDKILEKRKKYNCDMIILTYQITSITKRQERLIQDLLLRTSVPIMLVPFN